MKTRGTRMVSALFSDRVDGRRDAGADRGVLEHPSERGLRAVVLDPHRAGHGFRPELAGLLGALLHGDGRRNRLGEGEGDHREPFLLGDRLVIDKIERLRHGPFFRRRGIPDFFGGEDVGFGQVFDVHEAHVILAGADRACLALLEGRQENVLEPAPAAIGPSREHEFRGHALGLRQVRELVNGWTAEPSVADRLARRVFVHPLLPVISIGEDAEGENHPFQHPLMCRENEMAAGVCVGFEEVGDLRHSRRLASPARHGAPDRHVEFLDRALPRAVGQEVADDGRAPKVLEELGCTSIIGNLLTNGPWERAIEKFDVAIGCTMPGRRGQPPTMTQVPDLLKSHTDACSHLILATHEGMLKGVILTFGILSYGNHGEEWVDEDTSREPIGYGRFSGPAVHQLAHLAESKGVTAKFMFPGWAYGSGSWFKDMLLPAFEQGQARAVGSGENYMSFVHVEDLAEAYVLAAEEIGYSPPPEERPVARMFNLVDDQPITQKEWLSVVALALAKPIPPSISVEESAEQAGELWTESVTCSVRVKNDRAKSTLGWMLKYPTVRAGVPAAIDAIQKER